MSQITLTFPDGNQRNYDAGITAAEVAASIATSLAKKAISATVNGAHYDLAWPISSDATIAINTLKDEVPALELIRHDLAHIMARAVQEIWPDVKVTIGPVIQNGWYYDFDRAEPFSPEDLGTIEKKMRDIIAARDPVRTETWDRDRAIQYYRDTNEPYKVELVEAIPDDQQIRMYWHGDWQDLCRGPHLQHTGQVPADGFKLMSVAGAYWRGDSSQEQLQRIYGVAFRNKNDLKAHLTMLEEAAKRDHRKLGREMDLFHMQEEAPGQIFWHPNGWKIYTTLQDYMRRQQERGGYVEVNTPQVVDRKLWEASGHWDKYQENMFIVEVDEEHAREKAVNALKPMNCPCHVQIFNQGLKSYRDLPLRMAEFGSCNRDEPSGTLHGLMRVRGFTQDDAHIFCTEDQILDEVVRFNKMLMETYHDFGFDDIEVKLSTRPEKRVGSDAVWDQSEKALEAALKATGLAYEVQPGEGAFYGPKIEYVLRDSLNRLWQCGTIQLDFNLPVRLNAEYVDEHSNKKNPVMLHRAIVGSMERFIGILIEHYAGKFPVWLAPTQVVVMNISDAQAKYVTDVVDFLKKNDIRCESDLRNEKITYKIREHSISRIPFLLVIGDREMENKQVAVRTQQGEDLGVMSLQDFVDTLSNKILTKS